MFCAIVCQELLPRAGLDDCLVDCFAARPVRQVCMKRSLKARPFAARLCLASSSWVWVKGVYRGLVEPVHALGLALLEALLTIQLFRVCLGLEPKTRLLD